MTPVALGGRFRRGLGLSLLNTMLSRVGTFLLGVLLARLLAPEDFGIYATALVVQHLLLTFNDLGAAAAVVRRAGDVSSMLRTAWSVSVGGGVIAFTVCVISAPWLSSALGSPRATDVVRLLAVNALLDGFAAVPGALLTRELRQARRLVADLSGTVVNLLLTGFLAVAGFGVWSLAVGHVAGTLVVVITLLALTRQWPRFGIDRREFREVGSYGATVVVSGLLSVALFSTPQVVTGSLLGATALGFFYLAGNVASWPVSVISTTIERIALATFSRAREHGGDLHRAAAGVVGMVAAATMPGCAALVVLAGPLIQVLYGPEWAPAAAVLAGLAIAAIGRVLAELVFSLLLATGAMVSSVLTQVIWLVALVPVTVLAGGYWGLAGVAWAQAAVTVFVALPAHVWGLRRAGLRVGPLGRACLFPLALGLVTAGALHALLMFSLGPVVTTALGGSLTLAVIVFGYLRLRQRVEAAIGETDTPETAHRISGVPVINDGESALPPTPISAG